MILNLGGSSVMTYGEKPDGSSWKVALTDPRDTEGDYLGAITLDANQFLSTSGDYEKYFIEDGIATTTSWIQRPFTPSGTVSPPSHRLRPGLSGRWSFHRLFRPGMDAANLLRENMMQKL